MAAERGLLDNPRSDFAEMAAAHRAVLPQGAAAFIKELISVPSAQRRCACACFTRRKQPCVYLRRHVCALWHYFLWTLPTGSR